MARDSASSRQMLHSAVLLAAVILFFAHILKAACDAFSSEWRTKTCRALARVRRHLTRLCFRRCTMPDEISRAVVARMRARQLRHFRSVLTVSKWVLCVCMALHIFYFQTESLPHEILVLIGYTIALLADWCPWLVTEWSMDLWYTCFMVLLDLYIIPAWCSFEVLQCAVFFMRPARVFLGLALQRMPTIAFWNVVHVLSVCWGAVAASGPGAPPAIVMEEVVFMVLILLLTGLFAMHMELDCHAEVETEAKEEKQGSVTALMEMAYDVVVELDRDFRIAKPALSLSSFLLRPSPGALQYVPFEDLLFDEGDQAVFRTRFYAALSTASAKEVVHLRMRDGNGSAVHAELFGFRFRGLSGHPKCLLGVREFGDPMRRHCQGAGGDQLVVEADQTCPHQEEVSVVVDAGCPELPILYGTPAFSLQIMPVVMGSSFSQALVDVDGFRSWLQTTSNEYWNTDEDSEDIEGRARPAQLFHAEFRHGRARVQAACFAAMSGEAASDPYASEVRMRITFTGLVQMGNSQGSDCSSGRSRSQGIRGQSHGTPMASPRHSLEDPPHKPQGPLREAGCRSAGGAVDATTLGKSVRL